MQAHLAHLLSHYGYWGLCGALAIEYLFFPVPGETTLTAIGVFWQRPSLHLSLFWLLTSTTLGAFFGSLLAYFIGRAFGRPVLMKFGKYIRLTPERIEEAEAFFAKYTIPALFFSRYIAVIRILVPYLAGINKVRLIVYVPVALLSAFAWTTTFILAGSVIETAFHRFITHWQLYLLPTILVVAALVVGYVFLHRWMKRKIRAAKEESDSNRVRSGTDETQGVNFEDS